jgi:hypothetical protein
MDGGNLVARGWIGVGFGLLTSRCRSGVPALSVAARACIGGLDAPGHDGNGMAGMRRVITGTEWWWVNLFVGWVSVEA